MKYERETTDVNFCPLGDLLSEPLRNGLTKPKGIRGTGVKMVGMGEIFANSRIGDIPMDRVPATEKEKINCGIRRGDILFARQSLVLDGAGKCSIVTDVTEDTIFESHLIRARINESKANPYYVYYYFSSSTGKENIRTIVEQVAAAGIRGSDLVRLSVPCPALETQNKIVAVLSAIDEKIAVNQSINEKLEQQAQVIFNSFYGTLSGSPHALSEMIDIRDGTHDSPKAVDNGYPLVTSKYLLPFGVDKASANRISKFDYDKVNERSKVDTGDILISMIGTVGLISYVIDSPVEFAIKNVGLFKTSQHPALGLYILYYLKHDATANHIEKCLAGSTQKYISLGELRKMPIMIPSESELASFNSAVRPIVSQITLLVKENCRLAQIRDTLLPKLMSGEIDISGIST